MRTRRRTKEERREKAERLARERLLRQNRRMNDAHGPTTNTTGRPEPWQKLLRELRAETYFGEHPQHPDPLFSQDESKETWLSKEVC